MCLTLGAADLVAVNVFLVPAAVAELRDDEGAPAEEPLDEADAPEKEAPKLAMNEPAEEPDKVEPREEPAAENPAEPENPDEPGDQKAPALATPDKVEAEPAAPEEPAVEDEPPPQPTKVKKPPKPQRVFFKTASSRLPKKYKRRIKKLAKKDDENFKYIVTGAADYRGSSRYNAKLGEKRARAVREALTKLGVDPDRIETESVGEEKARKRQIWRDRKVTVKVVKDEP